VAYFKTFRHMGEGLRKEAKYLSLLDIPAQIRATEIISLRQEHINVPQYGYVQWTKLVSIWPVAVYALRSEFYEGGIMISRQSLHEEPEL
jgi:hypothetical protein